MGFASDVSDASLIGMARSGDLDAFARDVPQVGEVGYVAVEQVQAVGEMGSADAESQPMAAAESAALQDTGAPAVHSEPRQTGVAESAVSPDESQVAGETHETQRKEAFPVIALEIRWGLLLAALASLTFITSRRFKRGGPTL